MSKSRIILGLGVLLVVLAGLGWVLRSFSPWTGREQASPEARAFWERFYATNAAWLNPQPPALAYETVVQQRDRDYQNNTDFWRDTSVLQSWCTPDKNVRFREAFLGRAKTNYHYSEYRYVRGRGGRVKLRPGGGQRELELDFWLAGRNGSGFLSSLHLVAAWGLPPTASVQPEAEGMKEIQVTNLVGGGRAWRKELMTSVAYGLHPTVFASQTPCLPDRMRLRVYGATWLPAMVEELDAKGQTEARVIFEEPWLEAGGRPVPRVVRCELPRQHYVVKYTFGVEQGVWLLKECERLHASGYSLCGRSYTRNLQVRALPNEVFPGVHDLDLPDHSVTTLGPGERMVPVPVDGGLTLEGKLSLPPGSTGPAPVVLFLPGAGPWSFDRPLVYPDFDRPQEMAAPMKVRNYCDFFAQELGARGIGFFRMNKRGCGILRDEEGYPREVVNRRLFSQATPPVLLADYRAALRVLREQAGVDAGRVVLLGASEGTRLAPRLALAEPAGVAAVVLFGYSEHNTRDTIFWQHTVGPWRNIARIFDSNGDQKVTRQEYDAVVQAKGRIVSDALPFANLDRNRDGVVTPREMDQQASAEAIFKAVRERDEDFLYEHLLCLSADYLLAEWDAPPTHLSLLRLAIPVGIFHGENDGSCRVEGVREAEAALARAGRTNLQVRIYPRADHDLNWASFLRDGKTPIAFEEMLAFIAQQVKR